MIIGFIGFGNMAQAIARGLLESDVISKKNIRFSNYSKEKRAYLEKSFQIKGTASNQEVWDEADVVILAVKPHQVETVLSELDRSQSPFVLSIAAGVPSSQLKKYLADHSFLQTMPNLNAQVQESITAIIENTAVSDEKLTLAKNIFETIGDTVVLPESQLAAFTAIAGSSPALTFLFIDTLARAAVKYGIPKDKATKIAAQAVLGSGKTIKQADGSPWTLIDQVSSPGGITVEGILSLLQDDFASSIISSVDAMVEKDRNMSKEE